MAVPGTGTGLFDKKGFLSSLIAHPSDVFINFGHVAVVSAAVGAIWVVREAVGEAIELVFYASLC